MANEKFHRYIYIKKGLNWCIFLLFTIWAKCIRGSIVAFVWVSLVGGFELYRKQKYCLWFFTGQCVWIEECLFTTRDETWMTIDTGDQTMWIALYGKTWEWPETGGNRMWVNFRWAREANDSLWIACVQQLIGPVAAVDTLIVGKTRFAWFLMWLTTGTFDIIGGAFVAFRIDAVQIFTARCGDWRICNYGIY